MLARSTRAESEGHREITDLLALFDVSNFNPHGEFFLWGAG